MFCKYCGTELTNDSVYCSECGRKLNNPMSATETAQKTSGMNDYVHKKGLIMTPVTDMPMAWYKWVVISMMFSAASYLIVAMEKLTNVSEFEEIWYDKVKNAATMDAIYGIVCLGLCALSVYVFFQLFLYRKKAGQQYVDFWILGTLVSFLYYIFTVAYGYYDVILDMKYGDDRDFSGVNDLLITIIVLAILLYVGFYIKWNREYFKKREHLFIT